MIHLNDKRCFVGFIFLVSALITFPGESAAKTWIIHEDGSGDATTIQAGIDASTNGDTVRVMPGTYRENIDFKGKAIAVLGSGAASTIIDGSRGGPCVRFTSGETRQSILCDFTVTGGTGNPSSLVARLGGGIYILNSGPSIRSNVITDNEAIGQMGQQPSGRGAGIFISSRESSLIEGNLIHNNRASGNGGGIAVESYCCPEIIGNTIRENWTDHGDGGGIWMLLSEGGSVVQENRIELNTAGDHGGGIYIGNLGVPLLSAEIHNNVVVKNTALWQSGVVSAGGGIWLNDMTAQIYENTIAFNSGSVSDSTSGGGIGLDESSTSVIERNIIAFNQGGGIRCDLDGPATIRDNLVWMNQGGHGLGLCQGWEESNGNLVADPEFCDPENNIFSVAGDSPALSHPSAPLGAIPEPGCGPVAARRTTWGLLKSRYLSGN